MSDPQQILDAKRHLKVRDTLTPNVPLFLDEGARVEGASYAATLDSYQPSWPFISSWRRGLISDAHFAGGFRTCGDAFAFARGTLWDRGPWAGGWPTVTSLRIVGSFTRNYSGNWRNQVLAGIHGLDPAALAPDGNPAFGPNPSPWILTVDTGAFTIYYRTAAGELRTSVVPVDTTASTISLDTTTMVPEGLYENSIWPFGLGRCPTACIDAGYWGQWLPGGQSPGIGDVTFNGFDLHYNGATNPTCRVWGGRANTYPGGPSLPLLSASAGGSSYLLVVRLDQGQDDVAQGVTIRNLTVLGRDSSPIVSTGGGLGLNLMIDGCRFVGGSRAVQSLGLSVLYPVTILDTTMQSQLDCGPWFLRASGLTVERCQINYAVRVCGDFVSCSGWVKGDSMYAPGAPVQQSVHRVTSGNMRFDRIASDYEGGPFPAGGLIEVRPWTYFDDKSTTVNINGCRFAAPGGQTVVVRDLPVWAATPQRLIPCSVTVDDSLLASTPTSG